MAKNNDTNKIDYSKTLNLPTTDFAMRASLPQREPGMLDEWYKLDVYGEMMKKNADKPKFVLHDGPPYANGDIHIGHALNKILKDFIVKYKNMTGFCSPFVPGWDCHGLPTETAIIKKHKLDRNKIAVADFRDKCRDFTLGYVDSQREQFKRLGVVGDWENPYITLQPEFEAEQIKIFGEMAKKGYIYKGFKTVYWCPFDETALAEAEIEYSDDSCESIFVKFKVQNDNGKLGSLCDLDNTYFVIWTTTTWTLPGNLAICLNADYEYILMKAPCGETYIVAKELADNVAKAAGIEEYETLATLKGSDFELMTAKHPFLDRESIILNGEHVTLEAGTGCVHTAPGHGGEDFDICQKYDKEGRTNIGVIVPVDAKGVLTAEAGPYAGLYFAKANEAIFNDIKESGALLASQTIVHQYPHCWRCKNPIIYRATEQWFASVSAMTEAAVKACDDIKWHPEWGKERMIAMIRERNDWCISRQRNWGVPLPIFYCAECGEYIITEETISHISDMFREEGSNAWYKKEADELVPAGLKCPKCGHDHFTKETDIMDVWFDSGSTHAAVCKARDYLTYPADIYLEGGDQYRGWFQSSMLTSIAANGIAPYKQIITHGWTVDGEGKAMHKSLGNTIAPDEVIKDNGADILRLWVSSVEYTNDAKISKDILKQLSEVYRKIRNTSRILLADLSGFNPDTDCVCDCKLEDIDKWALAKLNDLIKEVRDAYDNYDFHVIYHAINNFCTTEMSKLYIDITKDRMYVEEEKAETRRAVQTVMYRVLDAMVRMVAPILTFTANEIWLAMPHAAADDARHVLLNDIPQYKDVTGYEETEAKWDKLFDIRDDVMKALEEARATKLIGKSLEAKITVTASDANLALLNTFTNDELKMIFIVSQVILVNGGDGIAVEVAQADGVLCDRCWMRTTDGEDTADGGHLCERCAAIVKKLS